MLAALHLNLLSDLPCSPPLELYVLPDGGRLSENIYGAEGSRTPDLCSAIAALSQLSYSPARSAPPFTYPVALRSFNDTTPLARGRTVDT